MLGVGDDGARTSHGRSGEARSLEEDGVMRESEWPEALESTPLGQLKPAS